MLQLVDEDQKIIGDCYRTALACILDRDPSEVPHFAESTWYDADARRWLVEHYGLTLVRTRVQSLANGWQLDLEKGRQDVYHLVIGRTARGTLHACVGLNGKVVWDPHPSRSGLTEIIEFEFLVPLNYANLRCVTLADNSGTDG